MEEFDTDLILEELVTLDLEWWLVTNRDTALVQTFIQDSSNWLEIIAAYWAQAGLPF